MSSAVTPGETGPLPASAGGTMTVRLAAGAWGIAVGAGVLSILLGLAVIAWPKATVGVIAVLFGLQLLVQGVFRMVQAAIITEESGGMRVLYALLGLLSFAVGILALRHLTQTVAVLALLFGLFWFIGGTIEFFSVLSDRGRHGRALKLTLSAASCLVGLLVLAYPAISLTALLWILGLWLITWGALTVVITLVVRHLDKRAAAPE